jgi:hypothetical protein
MISMKKLFIVSILLALTSFAKADINKPDFAYPRQVISDAESALVSAQKSRDGLGSLQALMQIAVAKNAIDRDSTQTITERVLAVSKSQSNKQIKSLMDLYAASLVKNIYNRRRYVYDRRQLPALPRPADMAEWSGEMFNAVIDSLCNLSWQNAGDMPTSDLLKVIDADDLCRRYYPTQADFVASQILNNFTNDTTLCSNIRAEMLTHHSRYSAAWCNWQALQCVERHSIADLLALYKSTPEEYRSNAAVVFQYILNIYSSNEDIDVYGPQLFIDDVARARQELKGTWAETPAALVQARAERPWLRAKAPSYVAANTPFDVKLIDMRNVKKLIVKVLQDKKLVNTFSFKFEKCSPVASDTVVRMQVPQGNYRLTYSVNDGSDISCGYISSVLYMPIAISNDADNAVHVVNAITGASVSGVSVSIISRQKTVATAVTDKSGLAHFANSVSGYVSLKHNGITQDFSSISLSNRATSYTDKTVRVSFTTDMPIYMPGDSVQWVGLLSSNGKPQQNMSIKVNLYATYDDKTIAEGTYTSDDFGRIIGKFAIPADATGGTYQFTCPEKNIYSSSTFDVSEFKPVSIKIDDLIVWPRKTSDNSAVVSGTVTNYSGFGIDNATIECTLGSSNVQGYTDVDGKFELTVPYPSDITNYAPIETRVTAADGTAVSQKNAFYHKFPYSISVSNRKSKYDTASPISFNVDVIAPDKSKIDMPICWALYGNSSDVSIDDGVFQTPGAQNLDFSNLPAGDYKLKLSLKGSTLADSQTLSLQLYNTNRAELPDDDACIYVPNDSVITAPDGNSVSLTVGVRNDNTIVYTVVGNTSTCIAHKFNAGYHTLTVDISDLPAGESILRTYAVNNLICSNKSYSINRQAKDNIKFVTESFRDKIDASATEQWHFSIVDSNDKPVQSAMTLTVYDKRLSEFSSLSSLYIPAARQLRVGAYCNFPYSRYSSNIVALPISRISYTSLQLPEWLYQPSSVYTLSSRGPLRMSMKAMSVSEEKAEATEVADEVATLDGSNVAVFAAADSGEVNYEQDEADVDDSLSNVALRSTTDYLGLWCPDLRSNEKGGYDVNFVVPNVNTTWHLEGFAWTKDGKSVRVNHDFVAAKPIMATVNAPRFVRGDDHAEIAITVMNNSDAVQNINIAALVDADSLAVGAIAKQSFAKTLQPGESSVFTISLDATQKSLLNAGSAYVSAKVSNGTSSDGERVCIPVLPSQTLVVNSTNFYLNPSDDGYEFDVPDSVGSNFSCSLTFTENPMWTIVEALPKLVDESNINSSATCQASAYFSAAVALGLMKQHPELELQFNASQLQKLMSKTQQNLIALQHADGSWRWGRWCTVGDIYATESILSLFAVLIRSGYLPSDSKLTNMLSRAVTYTDNAVKDTDMLYTINRPAFDNVAQSLNGKCVSNATVQEIIKNWKSYDASLKARAALALHYTGNKNMAKTLMGSLDEFGTQTKTKGFEFMNVRNLSAYAWLLQAYASVTPQSAHVDGIRQYLIVRKQATDWGNYPTTSQIVSAMINSGTKWTVAADGATVTVDGAPLNISANGRMGTLTTELTGRHVAISANGKTPSYGAFIARYNAPMTAVDAYSDGEISIDKSILVQRNGKWLNADSLRVGDKVKTVLTIKASRPFSNLVVTDDRAATFMPKVQVAGWVYGDGISAYRESANSLTNLYINYMPKGTYILEYELTANNAGQFASGLATVTCSQAPELTAHSAGDIISVYPK